MDFGCMFGWTVVGLGKILDACLICLMVVGWILDGFRCILDGFLLDFGSILMDLGWIMMVLDGVGWMLALHRYLPSYIYPAYVPGSSASHLPPYLRCTVASYLCRYISPSYLPGLSAVHLPTVSRRSLDGLAQIVDRFFVDVDGFWWIVD